MFYVAYDIFQDVIDSIYVALDLKHVTHVTIRVTMTHPVDSILKVTEKLQALRERMGALDAERVALQQQIDACVNELGSTVEGQRLPPVGGTMTERILAVLRRNKHRPLSPRGR